MEPDICSSLKLASFTGHNAFEIHASVECPFYCFACSFLLISRIPLCVWSSISQLRDICVVPSFWWLQLRLVQCVCTCSCVHLGFYFNYATTQGCDRGAGCSVYVQHHEKLPNLFPKGLLFCIPTSNMWNFQSFWILQFSFFLSFFLSCFFACFPSVCLSAILIAI